MQANVMCMQALNVWDTNTSLAFMARGNSEWAGDFGFISIIVLWLPTFGDLVVFANMQKIFSNPTPV
jgi:hypothetical protein